MSKLWHVTPSIHGLGENRDLLLSELKYFTRWMRFKLIMWATQTKLQGRDWKNNPGRWQLMRLHPQQRESHLPAPLVSQIDLQSLKPSVSLPALWPVQLVSSQQLHSQNNMYGHFFQSLINQNCPRKWIFLENITIETNKFCKLIVNKLWLCGKIAIYVPKLLLCHECDTLTHVHFKRKGSCREIYPCLPHVLGLTNLQGYRNLFPTLSCLGKEV